MRTSDERSENPIELLKGDQKLLSELLARMEKTLARVAAKRAEFGRRLEHGVRGQAALEGHSVHPT